MLGLIGFIFKDNQVLVHCVKVKNNNKTKQKMEA